MWYTTGIVEYFFDICISNPFKTWWKARKYFRRPKLSFQWYFRRSIRGRGKILSLHISDIQWKDKYDSPRHEFSPFIEINLLNVIGLHIESKVPYFNEFGEEQDGSVEYWEYLLDWLYYKDRKTLKCYPTWVTQSQLYEKVTHWAEVAIDDVTEPYPYIIPCVAMSLNKRGIKELKRELHEQRGNSGNYQIFSQEPGVLWEIIKNTRE